MIIQDGIGLSNYVTSGRYRWFGVEIVFELQLCHFIATQPCLFIL